MSTPRLPRLGRHPVRRGPANAPSVACQMRLALLMPVICTPRMPIVSPLLSHLYHSGSHAEPGPGLQLLGNHGVVPWLWREPQVSLHVSRTQTRRIELERDSG